MANNSGRLAGRALTAAAGAGLLDPDLLAANITAVATWGASAAMPYVASAIRHPRRAALIDDIGTVTYKELHKRTTAVAGALQATDLDGSTTVGILCRNGRGFLEANVATAKLGARPVYLNTGLAPAQLAAVIANEKIDVVLGGGEYADPIAASSADFVLVDDHADPEWSFPTLDRRRRFVRSLRLRPSEPVILTSGTTGTPKGARRPVRAGDAMAALGILERLPFRRGDVAVIPAPLFHAWGLSQHALTAALAGTIVLRAKFDPAAVMADVETHRARTLVVVPTMLRRILDADVRADVSSLRAVVSSGAALPGTLALEWMDRYGDTLYNFYGSTEVGQVTIADPDDLREAPGTAGRAAPGVRLLITAENGVPMKQGGTGRIMVQGSAVFAGYTGGGSKREVAGAVEIGDTGHLDGRGRLFVAGRVDDMIISGGENLYPRAIEDALLEHPRISEVAVVGVPDQTLGQKVRAVVVTTGTGPKPGVAALKKHAAERLAVHEVPREFVFLDELPRNETGKILRRTLTD
jgi:acyl-CoA synthetase (AMP-forming)/AMP-acid ligase II